ncbi:MAG: methionyl-tRNA formyltransferase, partial [Oscillospiraceae bacterium]|nr:methionyl-tRNA formyltransferase [Oscillospiraceae bacterium]
MRIVFMGTPAFAVASLRRLKEDGHELVGVFTQPDKPGNRKRLTVPPVKEYALSVGLPVYQPETLRDGAALALLRALSPELTVTAAYGQLLPEDILNVPRYGSINVHPSLLPKYRGAAPINRALLNGERETGVTVMYMTKRLDAGDVISVRKTAIGADEDAEALFARLADLGAELLSETVFAIANGTAARTPQNDAEATYAHMLSRELSPIDWSKSAEAVVDQVRALVPWPCASMTLGGKTVKVWRAERGGAAKADAGTFFARANGIECVCGDGNSVLVTELQSEGGKRMAAGAWLNGRR